MTFNLTAKAGDLAGAAKSALQVVDASSPVPILRTLLVAVASGSAEFTGTNTSQTVRTKAIADGDGEVCIDGAALVVKLGALRQDEGVSIKGDGKTVTISQGRTKWKIQCLPPIDFPRQVASAVEGAHGAIGSDFGAAIGFASSAIETNLALSHAGLRVQGNLVIATDLKRVHVIEIGTELPTMTLPVRVLKLIPDRCEVVANANSAMFSNDARAVKTRLVEGNYPDLMGVIDMWSKRTEGEIIVERADFLKAIERASAIRASGEKAGSFINMQLRIRKSEIEVFARNHSEGEESSDFCACDTGGPDLDIGMNGGVLADSVRSMTCEVMKVTYGANNGPLIMTPIKSDRKDIRLVMPRVFS